jgi:hypothetical protein
LMATAQREAADIGADYTDAVAESQGVDPGPPVNRDAYTGVASDGRSLSGLFAQPLIGLFASLVGGMRPARAIDASRFALDEIVTTQIQDVARVSEQVSLAVKPEFAGYLRTVEPGACGRCIILAGRFYKWNEGFLRHPKCRCDHRPLTRASDPQSPQELFEKMSPADQARAFTKSGAEAIRLGADPGLVVNARRGMSTAAGNRLSRREVLGRQVYTTTEGTTKRGLAYQRLGGKLQKSPGSRYRRTNVTRLMPESILEVATSREDAIRLLRLHAYII